MNRSGRVPDGVGFVAEVQSLFYPQFDAPEADALTGVSWPAARREMVRDQLAALSKDLRAAAAVEHGLFGLSAGEGFRGRTYEANGPRTGRRADVLHPHYLLMAGQADPRADATLARLRELEARGLLPSWGLVENVTVDLTESLPVPGSLNAGFEAVAAYHLAAKAVGRPDALHAAARTGPLAAVRTLYRE